MGLWGHETAESSRARRCEVAGGYECVIKPCYNGCLFSRIGKGKGGGKGVAGGQYTPLPLAQSPQYQRALTVGART